MKLTPALKKKLSKIQMFILDVDGILTDGKVFWIQGSGWTRFYSVKDGYGIRLLQRAGIGVAAFSGGDSADVTERLKHLKFAHVYLGSEDKAKALAELLAKTGLKPDQCAYMGDELFDIPVLEKVGFSATVPHAPPAVKKSCDYVTREAGGDGAVREVINGLLEVRHLSQKAGREVARQI